MSSQKFVVIAILVGACSIFCLEVSAESNLLQFPENYATGVKWLVADRPQFKRVHEYYVTPGAIEAARAHQPMPEGTVFVGVQYHAQLDPQGNPVLGPDKRFIKANLFHYVVMEKRAGWGTEYPPELRNGDWKYQAFKPDKTPDESLKATTCLECHKTFAANDFIQAFDKLLAATQ